MVRNSTKKSTSPAGKAHPPAAAVSSPSPSSAAAAAEPTSASSSQHSAARRGGNSATTASKTRAGGPKDHEEKLPSGSTRTSSRRRGKKDENGAEDVEVEVGKENTPAKPVVSTIENGAKSFTCPSCEMLVKIDAELDESVHKCPENKLPVIRPRKRLRGLPPYQYLVEEDTVVGRAGQRRTTLKKPGTANDSKLKSNPERDAWLRDHVMGKVYDPEEVWCRYCGCQQASGFSRGPWGSKKLCTIHYVQWFKKGTLDLSRYAEEPTEPINRMENTEYDYIKRMQAKTQKETGDDSE